LIHPWADDPLEVIHQKTATVSCFGHVALLRICRQIHREAARVLYGENTFVFDIRGRPNPRESRFVWQTAGCLHDLRHEMDWTHWIQKVHSHESLSDAIDRLLRTDIYQPADIRCDPLRLFLGEIGRRHASFITKIKIEGHFQTFTSWKTGLKVLDFALVLPVYTEILREVCQNIQTLTLHTGHKWAAFVDTVHGKAAHTLYPHSHENWNQMDEERVYETVRRVVERLPMLKHLRLGDFKTPRIPACDIGWGKSHHWTEVVEARTEMRKLPPNHESVGREGGDYAEQGKNRCFRGKRYGRGQWY
jgi:hypothetical protein